MAILLRYRQKTTLTSLTLLLSLLAFCGQAQTVHAIVVADTTDPILYTACKRDMETMHRQFFQLASAIKYQLSEQVIAGKEFTHKRLNDVIRTLSPGPDDIIFLYYTGHGYNASPRAGRFPVLYLEKNEKNSQQNPGLLDIHEMLKAKKARLCITMGDCCNQLIPNMRGRTKKAVKPKPLVLTDDSLNAVYRTLFLNVKGDALIASSRPPEQAYAHPDSGSFYTRSFDEALELASRHNKTVSWEALLRDTQTRLTQHKSTRMKQSIYVVSLDKAQTYTQSERITIAKKALHLVQVKYLDNLKILTHYEARQPVEALQHHIGGLVKDAFLNRDVPVFNEFRKPTAGYTTVEEYVKDCRLFAGGRPVVNSLDTSAIHCEFQQTEDGQSFVNLYLDKQVQGSDKQGKPFRFRYLAEFRVMFVADRVQKYYHSFRIVGINKAVARPPAAFTLTEADIRYVDNGRTVARQKELPTVLASLAGQLKEHLPDSTQQLTLEMFTYKGCGVNTPLSDRIFATLGSCLQKRTAIEVVSPGQNRDSRLVIRGSYQENLNTLRITTELYDTRTNQVLTVLTNTDLPLAWISEQQLTLKPDNYQQLVAIRDSLQQKAPTAPMALTVTIRTDKGRTNVEYWEGSQLVVEAKANRPCHVRLVYVLADGRKVLLENDYEIKPGQENQYVRIRPDLPFDCSAPFGMEYLLAYAAEEAFCPIPRSPDKTVYLRTEDGYDLFVGSIPEVIKASTCTKRGTPVAEDRIQITTRGLD